MNNQNVKPIETAFILTHALRTCRRKVYKKGAGFGNEKVTPDEKSQFENCLGKYLDVSSYSQDAMREGLLQSIQ